MRVISPQSSNTSVSAALTASSPRLESKPLTKMERVSVGFRFELALARGAATSTWGEKGGVRHWVCEGSKGSYEVQDPESLAYAFTNTPSSSHAIPIPCTPLL
jgi:hypothetical protein